MFYRPFNQVLRVLLAVAVLLGAGRLPAFEHAHHAYHGGHSHRGEIAAAKSHAHRHACSPDHGHSHSGAESSRVASRTSAEIESFSRHGHLDWFGFDFYFPPHSGTPVDADVQSLAVVPTSGDVGVAKSASPAPMPIALSVESQRTAATAISIARSCSVRALAVSLCDTARHERSGVQLF
jgi:hypothetical protein